ncbi:hypothetical protein [Mesorhizobium sp. ORS 3428]|uniref:hypothetical protein n=1 Tax=Mesorhizobium sp. ORS 3428 TaxID=540997 RepID=UPI0012FF5F5E|nr:hypothetical protein [Mesorhizobium sp. ORS 3428]
MDGNFEISAAGGRERLVITDAFNRLEEGTGRMVLAPGESQSATVCLGPNMPAGGL